MSFHLSRRQFLGTSLALCVLPSRLFAAKAEDVEFRFAVMSDVHYPGKADAPEVKRFRKALEFMNRYSSEQEYSSFDALLVAGDMSNNGTENQIGPFKKDLDDGLKPETRPVLCMGNHEFYGGSKPLWEKTFGVAANTHEIIGGYHFIALSPEKGTMRSGDYEYALDWLRGELEKAVADDPHKPIFMIQHYHVSETVYGSLKGDNWGVKDLYELLQEFPRVVNFSGHSHYPITDPRSAWQGNFTAFGTGTLSYFEMTSGKYNKFPPGHRNVGQFYVVEVYKDDGIVLKPYDLITDSFYDTVYTVAEPGNIDKYLYTDARYDRTQRPRWKANSKLQREKTEPYGATFRFPQAEDDEAVHSYRLDFDRKEENAWASDYAHYAWSNYFYRNMPDMMTVPVYELEPETQYRLRITALDCFQKESETTLDMEFSTPKDPDAPKDRNAGKPRADILDVHFTEQGAVNTPSNMEKAKKEVEIIGKPRIENDETNGFRYALFDGRNDAYKIRFSDGDYGRMRRRITMGARFRIDEFSKDRKTSDLFANTENGGYCFEINHQKKTLEFWCHVGGNYIIVSAPFSAGEFHTAYGVYDGRRIRLYLDGKEVAGKDASGLIRYPSSNAAKAFCVGADINSGGGASNHFEGRIVFARIYGWALTEPQIRNLSGNAQRSE